LTAYSRYASREAVVYYALVAPAIVTQTVFAAALASNPAGLVPQITEYGPLLPFAVQALPLLLLLLSVYAVLSFRPSVLVTLLVASFFVSTSASAQVELLGAPLNLGEAVAVVVLASFMALIGFSYARGLKLLGGRELRAESAGPPVYQALGLLLDFGFPIAASIALVAVVEAAVGAFGVQAARLPEPLSTLATLYVQTRVGLVFTTLLVAGAMIWILRQFVEPAILYFTLTYQDGVKELLSEVAPTTKKVAKLASYRATGGLSWGVLGVFYCIGIAVAVAVFLPPGETLRDLQSVFNLKPPAPSPLELALQRTLQNAVIRADILVQEGQDFARSLINLLWG
jgi:hypothetical protein